LNGISDPAGQVIVGFLDREPVYEQEDFFPGTFYFGIDLIDPVDLIVQHDPCKTLLKQDLAFRFQVAIVIREWDGRENADS
jgi:hypothetical protein